ncbi:MAG: hypothetical protein KGD64_04670 [Candidatus Heimdallarchaeota archaeon]|nr:hypothetical protein [Candidatus Heimdallarchaeota archaeon]
MSDEEEYGWTTVWALTSIYFAQIRKDQKVPASYKKMAFPQNLKKYENICEIIYMGDFINRAIFNDDELIDGIKRLTNGGFITEQDGFLLTTQKFEHAYSDATKTMKNISIEAALHVIAGILETKLHYE